MKATKNMEQVRRRESARTYSEYHKLVIKIKIKEILNTLKRRR